MKKILLALLFSASITAAAQTASEKDTKFVRTATEDGLLEIKLAELAQSHAASEEVKTHAKHMLEDHTKINEDLKNLASKKNISTPASINEMQQKIYDKMAKLNGKSFDKKYAKCMIRSHKRAICLYKKEAKKGDDAELLSLSFQTVPVLEHHREMWKEACKKLK